MINRPQSCTATAKHEFPQDIAIRSLCDRRPLYDIDLLINLTLVYGGPSAVLAGTYFPAVLAFETVLRPFTAGSDVSVALSTLAVVALFAPLRGRVQGFVDRRFYRSRYDAARTLDRFSVRLRDEVDLDAIERELIGVVRETVEPARASVWLRR